MASFAPGFAYFEPPAVPKMQIIGADSQVLEVVLSLVEGIDYDKQSGVVLALTRVFDSCKWLEKQVVHEPLDACGVTTLHMGVDQVSALLEFGFEGRKRLRNMVGQGLDHESRFPLVSVVVAAQVHGDYFFFPE